MSDGINHSQRVHFLRDLLKGNYLDARILSFAHNSDWLVDAPAKTIQQIGNRLIEALTQHRSGYPHIPIIFIGHSFGGIIIKQALCESEDRAQELVDNTCGIVFLGTPHYGSSVSHAGYISASLTGFLGSNSDLLLALASHQNGLSDLEDRFIGCMRRKESRRQKTEIVSFYETKPTYMLNWISLGIIVSRDSARGGHAATTIPIDTDHSGLNKCNGKDAQLYRELCQHLDRIRQTTTTPSLNSNQQFVIEKLHTVNSAAFDSYDNEHNPTCLDGTRRELLEQIDRWAGNPTQEHIYWLQGKAGTGKSTIARTVATRLANTNRLAASFFFKRGEGDRGNARYFFTTITAQLVQKLPEIARRVREVIEAEPDITRKSLAEQFQKLILKPIEVAQSGPPMTMAIVIDALDECEGDRDIQVIIYQLSQMSLLEVAPLRVFVTSRFEPPIRLGFRDIDGKYIEIPLHTIPKAQIERDIKLFLQYRLKQIQQEFELVPDWPSQDQFDQLLAKAIPLFIFAATACRFIEDGRQGGGDPGDRLREILEYQAQGDLASTYLPTLNQMLSGLKALRRKKVKDEFEEVVGSIITLAAPLTATSLAGLLGVDLSFVENRLRLLHSVLDIPLDATTPVRLFHESFRDFLTQPDQKDLHDFWIDQEIVHGKLASKCLKILSGGFLKQDICELKEPGMTRDQIDQATLDRYLPPEVRYACLYWVHHLKGSLGKVGDGDQMHTFLRRHFLHWLEALSLIGMVAEGIRMIRELRNMVTPTNSVEAGAFLDDAERFTVYFHQMIGQTPLQIYFSGLLFSPLNSVIRRTFLTHVSQGIVKAWSTNLDWNSCRQILSCPDMVFAVSFSTDGQQVLSGSNDGMIRIWDVGTGTCIQTIKALEGRVAAAIFSADGRRVISNGSNNTLHIWDANTGACLLTLEGHEGPVVFAVLSADGQWIASGSVDKTVRLWDINTGACVRTLSGHKSDLLSIHFLNDGKRLATADENGNINIWDVDTGDCLQNFRGIDGDETAPLCASCAVSPDSQKAAFGLQGGEVDIRDINTGEYIKTLQHDEFVHISQVVFSADGHRLISSGATNFDGSIRIWDTKTWSHIKTLVGHTGEVDSVTFSQDGQWVASGSRDETIRIWNATADATNSTAVHLVSRVEFSPNGKWALSCSYANKMNIWNVDSGTCVQTLQTYDYYTSISKVAFSQDDNWVALPAGKERIKIWRLDDFIQVRGMRINCFDIASIEFSANSRRAASISDTTVKVWDVSDGSCIYTVGGSFFGQGGMSISADGQRIATMEGNIGLIEIWNIGTATCEQKIESARNLRPLAFSANSQWLAANTDEWHTKVYVWNINTGACTQTFQFNDGFRKLAFDQATDSRLVTEKGILQLQSADETGSVDTCTILQGESHFTRILQLTENGEWVLKNGRKLLRLPLDYEVSASDITGRKLMTGSSTGHLYFMEFS
ncbi:hypothetical protein V8C37DRAFT_249141 [Trichoderma ceciliae]